MNRSAGTWVLIAAAVLIALVLVVYATASYNGERLADHTSTSSITVGSSTTFLVDPKNVLTKPAPRGATTTPAADQTPPAPAAGRGGFLGRLFSRVTGRDDLPSGYTQADLSPYYQKVTVSNVRRPRSTRTTIQPSSVQLKANAGDVPVVITGWQLKTNRSGVAIPRGVRTYHTTPTPLESIELRKGENATVYTSASPVGANFMLNKCSGYLARSYTFVPNIPQSCPRPKKGEIETFTGTCQEYILRLRTCEAGNPNNAQIPGSDPACRAYVASLNYEGCVAARQKDADFFRKEWRIWTGVNFLDPLHDRVLLLDQNGKLVDWYSY